MSNAMSSPMVALKVANLNDQKFLPELEEKFRAMQESLCRYVHKHDDKAKGAKAVLTVKITLAVEPTKDPSIKAEIEMKVPADPAHLSMTQFGFDEHGPCCKVQRAGSFGDSPRQQRLFTEDGRLIDPGTGEILDGSPADEGPTGTPDDQSEPQETGETPPAA